MASLTAEEFDSLIAALAHHFGLEKLHNRLRQSQALVSRRRPASVQALAGQLYQLTAGLRRNHPARQAVELLWQESLADKVSEERSKELEAIAGKINACLKEQREIVEEKREELLAALKEYYQVQREAIGDEAAYLEMLLRAVPPVAQILRENRAKWQELSSPKEALPDPRPDETEQG